MSVRIAMWSGPRNISTAMMRAWGNRPDTFVCDEPLYAHYLQATGIDHPGRAEVIARHETDWRAVVAWLTGPIPEGRAVFYQKHMAHHLLPEIDRAWMHDVSHAFLLRDPREMITSLAKVHPNPRLEETGLPQQVEIVRLVREHTGRNPPIVDARDVLEAPRVMLRRLCAALGVEFTDRMLSWPPGPRATDGVWAKHWYDAVQESTGFKPYRPKDEEVADRLRGVYEEAVGCYQELYELRLTEEAT